MLTFLYVGYLRVEMSVPKENVDTVTCPTCDRIWPHISEQAVVVARTGVCYACFMQAILDERLERCKGKDYFIKDCPECVAFGHLTLGACSTCEGNHWVAHYKEPASNDGG